MHYLQRFMEFTTVEEGEKCLRDAVNLQRAMVGPLYSQILAQDCEEISNKLEKLREEKRHVASSPD